MPLRKKSFFISLFLFLLPAVLVLGEFCYFLIMTCSDSAPEKADLIAIFTGQGRRLEEGFRLANQGYAGYLVVSSASSASMERYRRKLVGSKTFEILPEDKARTTFENALHTVRIMADRGMRTVILVTSWDHMPRSHLLLRMLSSSENIQIRHSRVSTGRVNATNWYSSTEGWKRAYNEMMELWGSLYEFAAYRIRGALPRDAPNQSAVVNFLREALLFDVETAR